MEDFCKNAWKYLPDMAVSSTVSLKCNTDYHSKLQNYFSIILRRGSFGYTSIQGLKTLKQQAEFEILIDSTSYATKPIKVGNMLSSNIISAIMIDLEGKPLQGYATII